MTQFKTGQKVRAIQGIYYGPTNQIVKGDVYTISSVVHNYVFLKETTRQWHKCRFEAFTPTVDSKYVETVTEEITKTIVEKVEKTRLKPGRYGQIEVNIVGKIFIIDKLERAFDFDEDELDETISALIAIRDFRATQKE